MEKDDKPTLGKKIRSAEKELTKGLIKWRFKRAGQVPPDEETLDRGSEKVVDEAHRVIKERGKNIFDEFKQAKKEFLKAYREDDDE